MGGRIAELLATVVGRGQNSTFPHDDRADRHLIGPRRELGLANGLHHPDLVEIHRAVGFVKAVFDHAERWGLRASRGRGKGAEIVADRSCRRHFAAGAGNSRTRMLRISETH